MVWSPSLLTCRPPNHSDQRPSRTPSTRTSYRLATQRRSRLLASLLRSLRHRPTLWSRPRRDITRRGNARWNLWKQTAAGRTDRPLTPSGDKAEPAGVGHGFGAVGRPELVEDVAGVLLHRLQGDHQLGGDVAVAAAGGQQPQHLQLPPGQRLDQPPNSASGAVGRCRGGLERLDDPVQVLSSGAGGSTGPP